MRGSGITNELHNYGCSNNGHEITIIVYDFFMRIITSINFQRQKRNILKLILGINCMCFHGIFMFFFFILNGIHEINQ